MSKTSIGLAAVAAALVCPVTLLAAPNRPGYQRQVEWRCNGILTSHGVTGGGVSAKGRCTASGALSDRGTLTG